MVSWLTDWWFYLTDSYFSIRALKYRYCSLVGHITSPPYNFKDIDMGWPRCRRCEITRISDEQLPADFWTNREKYFH